jgi:hypothetical protein
MNSRIKAVVLAAAVAMGMLVGQPIASAAPVVTHLQLAHAPEAGPGVISTPVDYVDLLLWTIDGVSGGDGGGGGGTYQMFPGVHVVSVVVRDPLSYAVDGQTVWTVTVTSDSAVQPVTTPTARRALLPGSPSRIVRRHASLRTAIHSRPRYHR